MEWRGLGKSRGRCGPARLRSSEVAVTRKAPAAVILQLHAERNSWFSVLGAWRVAITKSLLGGPEDLKHRGVPRSAGCHFDGKNESREIQ